jgi:hypothetical protein
LLLFPGCVLFGVALFGLIPLPGVVGLAGASGGEAPGGEEFEGGAVDGDRPAEGEAVEGNGAWELLGADADEDAEEPPPEGAAD